MSDKPTAAKFKDWLDAPEGRYAVDKLHKLIDRQHEDAENNLQDARDYMSRAKGVREALQAIQSLAVSAKKPKPEEDAEQQ